MLPRQFIHAICLFLNLPLLLCAGQTAGAESFGLFHEQVVLERTLPPLAPLGNRTLAVAIQPVTNLPNSLTTELEGSIEGFLTRSTSHPRLVAAKSDILLFCTVTSYSAPHLDTKTENQTTYWAADGSITVVVRVVAVQGMQMLASGTVTGSYVDQGDTSSLSMEGLRIRPKHPEPVPNETTIENRVTANAAQQIASYVVDTTEKVPVYLARGGALDNADKLAVGGLWNRYLESLELITPQSEARKEAYRLYDLGVANEALGYQTQDARAATKYLEQASNDYGKALDAQPGEKFFLEPQQRIMAALLHYQHTQTAHDGNGGTDPITKPLPSSLPTPNNGSPVTNADVLSMLEYHMDEGNIIDNITSAAAVRFDLSVPAQLQLMKAGLTSKELSAMKKRAQKDVPSTH